jgi:hypothetical protein
MASAMADQGLPAYKLIFNAGTQLHGATAAFLFSRNDAASKCSYCYALPLGPIVVLANRYAVQCTSKLTPTFNRRQQRNNRRLHERLVHLLRYGPGSQRQSFLEQHHQRETFLAALQCPARNRRRCSGFCSHGCQLYSDRCNS